MGVLTGLVAGLMRTRMMSAWPTADHHRPRSQLVPLQPGCVGRRSHLRLWYDRYRSGDGALAGETIQEQTGQAITNCLAILEAGGAGYDDIVEVSILLTDPADFAGLNEACARAFPTNPPTRYVAKLGVDLPGVLVSVRMTAVTS